MLIRQLTFKCRIEKKRKKEVLVMSLRYTPVTQSILCLIFLKYVGTIQHLNYDAQESKKNKKPTVYDSDRHVTLKQGQGQQTWYRLEDSKQDYNNAMFEKNAVDQCP